MPGPYQLCCVVRMRISTCDMACLDGNLCHTTHKHMWTNMIRILLVYQRKTCSLERTVWARFRWVHLWGVQNTAPKSACVQSGSTVTIGEFLRSFALFCSALWFMSVQHRVAAMDLAITQVINTTGYSGNTLETIQQGLNEAVSVPRQSKHNAHCPHQNKDKPKHIFLLAFFCLTFMYQQPNDQSVYRMRKLPQFSVPTILLEL